MQRLQEIHRNAVALNNAGVTLLETHCYAEAVETLRRTNRLMRTLTCNSTGHEQTGQLWVSDVVGYFTRPARIQETSFMFNVVSVDGSTLEQTRSSESQSLGLGRLSPAWAYPVRIAPDSSLDDGHSLFPSIIRQSAIALHNTGLALLASSRRERSEENRKGAIRSFQRAYSVLSKQHTQGGATSYRDPVLFVAILTSWIQALERRNTEESKKADELFGVLMLLQAQMRDSKAGRPVQVTPTRPTRLS